MMNYKSIIIESIRNALLQLSLNTRYRILILLALRRGALTFNEIVSFCLNYRLRCKFLKKVLLDMAKNGEILSKKENDIETYRLSQELIDYADLIYNLLSEVEELVRKILVDKDIDIGYIVTKTLTIPAMLITISSDPSLATRYSKAIYMFISALQLEVWLRVSKLSSDFRALMRDLEERLTH